MKIIKASTEIIPAANPLKHIEKAYRLCYKSEDRITETSAKEFVPRMIGIGHLSPVEHFRFILEVPHEAAIALTHVNKNPAGHHIEFTSEEFGRDVISCSARPLIEAIQDRKTSVITRLCAVRAAACIASYYGCTELFPDEVRGYAQNPHNGYKVLEQSDLTPEEIEVHGWFTAKFVCDRGVTHEIVRHRMASYSQESTRYCNYSKGKFGNEITVIQPCFWEFAGPCFKEWSHACKKSEDKYFKLLELGATAQEARSVLPNSLKTELLMTTTYRYWKHFFRLRCDPAAHPQMREVAGDLLCKTTVQFSELREEFIHDAT